MRLDENKLAIDFSLGKDFQRDLLLLRRQLAGRVAADKPVVGIVGSITFILKVKKDPCMWVYLELFARDSEVFVVAVDI
ncbi:hypothetical protein ES703_20865 [subsurface metagenome]